MSGSGWINVSPVEVLVQRACDPSLTEPPYPIHVELAELINTKKANTPRDAAMATVRLVNHRNPHVSILALSLLDSLVNSCGYAMHLQISTKEFLNELVRRFPERPPPFPGPVMQRILELIHSWKEGICTNSRWKEDLGNIRDMHRLLSFKGYRFRDLPRNNGLNPAAVTENLKSPEELENEDREAQSAKLQELLRRGTPKDLAAAQELMKILAGAEPDRKPDYKAETLKELNKVEAKVILLNEMLDNVDTQKGEKFVEGDVYDQVSQSITAVTPKIQGWISDAETHDPDSLATFLQINDQINNVIARYEAFKKGDYSMGAVPPELSGPPPKDSLIDFMDDEPAAAAAQASGTGAADDLAGLFGPSTAATSTPGHTSSGSIGGKASNADILGMFSQPQTQPHPGMMMAPGPQGMMAPRPMQSGMGQFGGMGGMGQGQMMGAAPPMNQAFQPQLGAMAGQGPIMLPGTPQQQKNLNLGGSATGSRTGTPSLGGASTSPPMGQRSSSTTNANAGAQKDPFADLAGLF